MACRRAVRAPPCSELHCLRLTERSAAAIVSNDDVLHRPRLLLLLCRRDFACWCCVWCCRPATTVEVEVEVELVLLRCGCGGGEAEHCRSRVV